MAITNGTGTFAASLLDNGTPFTGTFTPQYTWTCDDTQATIAPSADTTSAVITVPAGDPATSVNITATTPAPDGTTATGTLNVAVTAVAQKFTVSISQPA